MAQTVIDTRQLELFQTALKQSPGKLREILQRTGVECAKILEHHLKRKAPKFIGELQSSIDGRAEMVGKNVEAVVVSPVPYAHVQDAGRDPAHIPGKMPPDAPIRRWVELKLFKRGGFFKKTLEAQGRKRARSGERQRALDSMTFLVRRKIAKFGNKPTRFIDEGLKAATPALKKRMDALAAEIARMLDE